MSQVRYAVTATGRINSKCCAKFSIVAVLRQKWLTPKPGTTPVDRFAMKWLTHGLTRSVNYSNRKRQAKRTENYPADKS
ncbi:MAG: hypothetical protein U5K84_14740 [Alkalibacterium sp.]|nr:hypothetical protein [Alkalibacterium sp.]